MASDIDLINGLVTQAHATPTGVPGVWKAPPITFPSFISAPPLQWAIRVDPNAGYWLISDTTGAYAPMRGQGSVSLQDALRSVGLTQ
jgi:hypothetical protein